MKNKRKLKLNYIYNDKNKSRNKKKVMYCEKEFNI